MGCSLIASTQQAGCRMVNHQQQCTMIRKRGFHVILLVKLGVVRGRVRLNMLLREKM